MYNTYPLSRLLSTTMGAIWYMHNLIHVLSRLMNEAMHVTDQKILFLKTALMTIIAVHMFFLSSQPPKVL
ncbi:hypothetical protein C1646_681814 [Rhizophagus diaphanus]|nr:hypothetical protein C1646_681814 [Rhizophagus diaphanus] [Rhizophagus sp. MUCL 43196]